MAFTPPPYPKALKRSNWDSNKGLLAKAKGFTGMGEGLAKLEAQYGKISWTQFDLKLKWGTLNNYAKAGFTVSKLDQDAKAAAAAAASGEVAKLRTEAFAVRDMADQTAKEYGKNPLFKSAATLAKTISTEADHLGVAVNANSLSSKIAESKAEVLAPITMTLNLLEKDFARLYKILETKAAAILKSPTYVTWRDERTMKACRDFNQVIGNASKIAPFGVDIGGSAAEYSSFFNDMNLYARVDVPFEEDAGAPEIKKHLTELVKLVKRAKSLR